MKISSKRLLRQRKGTPKDPKSIPSMHYIGRTHLFRCTDIIVRTAGQFQNSAPNDPPPPPPKCVWDQNNPRYPILPSHSLVANHRDSGPGLTVGPTELHVPSPGTDGKLSMGVSSLLLKLDKLSRKVIDNTPRIIYQCLKVLKKNKTKV